jgi:hypothetical protein
MSVRSAAKTSAVDADTTNPNSNEENKRLTERNGKAKLDRTANSTGRTRRPILVKQVDH